MEWQRIETAPKDGTKILALTDEGVDVVEWTDQWGPSIDDPGSDAGWQGWLAFPGCTHVRRGSSYWTEPRFQPTHWMPLPPPPAQD